MIYSEPKAISFNINHKTIGLLYLYSSIFFALSGALSSIVLRFELYSADTRFFNTYNIILTLHGFIMIFFFTMPGLFAAFPNLLIPLFSGLYDLVLIRINSLSLYFLPISFTTLSLSIISEFGYGTGWTLYPPLSISPLPIFIIAGLLTSGISSWLSSINFLVSYSTFGLYIYAIVLTSFLLLITIPILSATILMLSINLFPDPLLFQHLFWFFGHPEVYILILPAFAIISQILSHFKSLFAIDSMIIALFSISLIGCIVWAHHLYTVGLETDTRAYFTSSTIIISIPTATKIFNWLGNSIFNRASASYSLTLCFLITFTLGGTTGLILGNAGLDITLHDTYYTVAHFHFVLSIGAVTAFIAGISYYLYTLSLLFTFTFITAILITFIPQHFLAFHSMPRRISRIPDSLVSWNSISSYGSLLLIITLIFL